MGQYANQPDFGTFASEIQTISDTISSATNLNSSALFIGTGGDVKVILAGTVGPSVISGFSSPGYTGSGGTGYTYDANPVYAGTIGGSGTGLEVEYVTNTSDQVVSIASIQVPGSGYLNGDLITINDGDGNAVFRVVAEPGLPTASEAVTFKNLSNGCFLPVIVDYVLATGTTAADIIAVK